MAQQERFNIKGNRPAILSALYGDDLKDVWEPEVAEEHLVVLPMFEPLVAGQNVTFECNRQPCSADDVTGLMDKAFRGDTNYDVNAAVNEIFDKSLAYYGHSVTATPNMVYVNQMASMNQMDIANEIIHYTANTDVLPSAKQFLAGQAPIDRFIVSLGYTFRPQTLGVWVINEAAFDDFINFCAVYAAQVDPDLSADAKLAIGNLPGLKLDEPTLGLLLRGAGSEDVGNAEGSFARFIVAAAMEYAQAHQHTFGIMPFDAGELVEPHSIVFANVDAHAHAFPDEVKHAWEDVNTAIASKPKVLSPNQIRNLTAAQTALRKAKKNAQKADAASNRENDATQRNMKPFCRKWGTCNTLLAKRILGVLKKLGQVNRSENMYKFQKTTFMRPNRRDPENGDLMGRTLSTRYKPDIHLYLDTSGSISEENYQAAVMNCIKMAQKLNVNLYFNSFSHVMSSCTKLKLRNRSPKQIYRAFQRVRKVGGGTDYRQIWDYINASKKRQREFSLIITDFEWCVPRGGCKHPKNLYYFPIASHDGWEWDRLCQEAREFAQNMLHIDPKIRSKMLF